MITGLVSVFCPHNIGVGGLMVFAAPCARQSVERGNAVVFRDLEISIRPAPTNRHPGEGRGPGSVQRMEPFDKAVPRLITQACDAAILRLRRVHGYQSGCRPAPA